MIQLLSRAYDDCNCGQWPAHSLMANGDMREMIKSWQLETAHVYIKKSACIDWQCIQADAIYC
jgi:hypothetical protein